MRSAASNNKYLPQALSARRFGDEEVIAVLQKFDARFPTEKDCMEELLRRLSKERFIKCRYCGSRDFERQYGNRIIWCKHCRKKTWVTGGTFFHRMKTARPWLVAIWLMESGIVLSSSKFHKLVGTAQSSALHIFMKITTVVEGKMEERKVPTRLLSQLFCKRSRETPARKHPISEQDEFEKEQKEKNNCAEEKFELSDDNEVENNVSVNMNEQEKAVYACLSSESVNVNILSEKAKIEIKEILVILTMLELSGAVLRIAGDRYIRASRVSVFRHGSEAGESELCSGAGAVIGIKAEARRRGKFIEKPITGRLKTRMAARCMKFIRHLFHGISRKYVQNYLAAYWCCMNRKKWRRGVLLKACIQFGRLDAFDIFDYVSPLLVKMHEAALAI